MDKIDITIEEYAGLIEYIKTLEKLQYMKPMIANMTKQIEGRIAEKQKEIKK